MRQAARAIIVRDGNMLVMHRNKFGQQYYTLIGGGVGPGESPEQCLLREVQEECGFTVTGCKLVFVEDAGDPYGTQYIYYCEATGDQPVLSPTSPEAEIATLGKNLHTPVWLPIAKLETVPFKSAVLQKALVHSFKNGFAERPVALDVHYSPSVNKGSN